VQGVGNFATKLVAMATSLKIWKKRRTYHSSAIQYLPYGAKIVKIAPADLEIFWLRANESDTKQSWLPWQRVTPLEKSEKLDKIKKIHANTFHSV